MASKMGDSGALRTEIAHPRLPVVEAMSKSDVASAPAFGLEDSIQPLGFLFGWHSNLCRLDFVGRCAAETPQLWVRQGRSSV